MSRRKVVTSPVLVAPAAPAELEGDAEPNRASSSRPLPLRCRLGFHPWIRLVPTDEQYEALVKIVGGGRFHVAELLRSEDLWNRLCPACLLYDPRIAEVIAAGGQRVGR